MGKTRGTERRRDGKEGGREVGESFFFFEEIDYRGKEEEEGANVEKKEWGK